MNPPGFLSDVRVLGLRNAPAVAAALRLLEQLGAQVRWGDADTSGSFDAVLTQGDPALDLPGQPGQWSGRARVHVSVGESSFDESVPGRLQGQVIAALVGAHAAVAVLAAIRYTRGFARCVSVEVAPLEVIASCMGNLLPLAVCPRIGPGTADGPPIHTAPPVHIVPCADGFVGVSASALGDLEGLAAFVGLDPTRIAGHDVTLLFEQWARERTRLEIFHETQLWRLPIVPVLMPREIPGDQQSQARQGWTTDAEGFPASASPFRASRLGGQALGMVSSLGERADADHGLPLDDVRVLDLGMVWAGPYAGRLLAGLGAEVIKIEGPHRPDGTRLLELGGCQGAFADLNRGKASLVVDLGLVRGREIFLDLVTKSDVVLENFSPRVMPNFGLDAACLAEANPGIVSLSMPAFGSDGPWAHYVAFGSGLELASGLAQLDEAGRPRVAPVPYLDYLAGTYGAAGVLAALIDRDRSHRGCHLEVAQREVACQLLDAVVLSKQHQASDGGMAREAPPHRTPSAVSSPFRSDTTAEDTAKFVRESLLTRGGLFAGPDPLGQTCRHLARLPWVIHGIKRHEEHDAPGFGADTHRILREIAHLDPRQIEGLMDASVVAVSSDENVSEAARAHGRAGV